MAFQSQSLKNKTLMSRSLNYKLFALLILLGISGIPCRGAEPVHNSEVAAKAFGGERTNFTFAGHEAFVILPKNGALMPAGKRPWIWYAPTLVSNKLPGSELEWLCSRLLQAGFCIAGVDVGESYGNPAGRKTFSRFHSHVVKKFGFSPKACLLPQSRGGLMLYNWAVEHPEKVRCIGGIYTVCNPASYPGLDKAAPAYGMTREKFAAHLSQHNPIDRLAPLAKAKVPVFHIHGDSDTLVPLDKNAGELVKRLQSLGGNAQLVVVPGKGHEVCPEFFQSGKLLAFFLSQGGFNSTENHTQPAGKKP
jgi:hypothetical protein